MLRVRWPEVDPALASFPDGAAARADDAAWVLTTGSTQRSLGGALVWALSQRCRELHLLVDAEAGLLARMASRFDLPVTVWLVDGTELRPCEPDDPPDRVDLLGAPVDGSIDGRPAGSALLDGDDVATLVGAGLDAVFEDGIVHFEVLGLEVGRLVPDETDGPPHLESGVGRFDREMSAMLHAGAPERSTLLAAAEFVATHRRPGAPPHPLRDLCRERWIRRVVMDRPELVGARRLEPVATALARPNLRDPWPALAWGAGEHGDLTVLCTVGVDLGAIPLGADARAVLGPSSELVVVSVEPLPRTVAAVADRVSGETRAVVLAPPWIAPEDPPMGARRATR